MDRVTEFQAEYQNDDAATLLQQVQANSQALILATMAFLRRNGVAVDDWARFLGEQFAKDWPEDGSFGADEFLDAMLTNLQGFGAMVISTEFAPDESTATISGFPSQALREAYGVDAGTAAVFQEAARQIARSQGLTWDWELDGETVTIAVRTEAT